MERSDVVKGIPVYGAETSLATMAGYVATYTLQCQQNPGADGRVEVPADWRNCKGISCDVAGIARWGMISDLDGTESIEVGQVNAGSIRPARNVRYLYFFATNLFTSPTVGTAKSYDSAGVLYNNSIKLHR